jgi:hypothetical protein
MIEFTPNLIAVVKKINALEGNPDVSVRESMEAVKDLQRLERRMITENVMKPLISVLSRRELTANELSELKSFCLEGIIDSAWDEEKLAYRMLGKAILEFESKLDSGMDLNTSLRS